MARTPKQPNKMAAIAAGVTICFGGMVGDNVGAKLVGWIVGDIVGGCLTTTVPCWTYKTEVGNVALRLLATVPRLACSAPLACAESRPLIRTEKICVELSPGKLENETVATIVTTTTRP